MKLKKVLIIVLVLALLGGGIGGGIHIYDNYKDNKTTVDVVSVANMNWGYQGGEMQSSGMVTNDLEQDIDLEENLTVTKVNVEEGQTVSVGDPLLEYDMEQANLEVEMKQLNIQTIENNIAIANKKLEDLKKTTPVPDPVEEPVDDTEEPVDDVEEPDPDDGDGGGDDTEEPEVEEKTGNAYNYIAMTAVSYDEDSDGSSEKPFKFLCTPTAYVTGEYMNYLVDKGYTAVFEVRENNKVKGDIISSWTVNGKNMATVDDDTEFSVATKEQIDKEAEEAQAQAEAEAQAQAEAEEEARLAAEEAAAAAQEAAEEAAAAAAETTTTYTQSELTTAINETESELRDLDLELRQANLELENLKKKAEDGVVKATINGVVKSVQDVDNLSNDGTPFMVVVGSEGLYVTGSISELLLNDIKIGQVVSAYSWDSGLSFEATITSISQYPTTGNDYYGEGNQNVSYYPYTAYIEDSDGLSNGEYVDLTMSTTSGDASMMDMLCIEKAYVRQENGKSYVMKAGEDGRLVKQYVTTGKTYYGQAVEIKSGLTAEDYIAFPYGSSAKEGIKTEESSDSY